MKQDPKEVGLTAVNTERKEIRAMLLHLGTGMWWGEYVKYHRSIVHRESWNRLTALLPSRGVNMVVLDIGEMLRWPSHPELAYDGAWSAEEFRAELKRLRGLGLEPIPKLNFSTTHNWWLGEWRRCCSTDRYYAFCDELVRDAAAIFDRPRFCHIGFDEESEAAQARADCVIARKRDLWYHDLRVHAESCEKAGMRPWMWSDHGWRDREFERKCPKSIVQSDWYYDEDLQGFDPAQANDDFADRLLLMDRLSAAGFDQIPCGSNWKSAIQKAVGLKVNRSMTELVAYARARIDPKRMLGFMMSTWANASEKDYPIHVEGADVFKESLA